MGERTRSKPALHPPPAELFRALIQFALSFERSVDAERAATTLRGEGYQADTSLGHNGTQWLVSAVPERPITNIAVVRERMEALAASLRGEFLGHGGLCAHPLTDG